MVKLNELRAANSELNRQVSDTKKEKDELSRVKERLQREMDMLKDELRNVKADLSTAESERVGAMEEVKAMQQLMFEAKEHEVSLHSLRHSWISPYLPVFYMMPPFICLQHDTIYRYEYELGESKSNLEVSVCDEHCSCSVS
jgi:septal ring factor EnvC (AmiA/AmiB activator)